MSPMSPAGRPVWPGGGSASAVACSCPPAHSIHPTVAATFAGIKRLLNRKENRLKKKLALLIRDDDE